jgi:transcriptional regulator with XRE-family HTH domain
MTRYNSSGGHMVSTQIRDRRIAAGLTQEELAARARCASSTIRNIEAGRVSRPEHTTIDAIGEALGLTLDELRAWKLGEGGWTAGESGR